MKSFVVTSDKAGKKVVRVAVSEFPAVTPAILQKALRHKDIRINGKRVGTDEIVSEGDHVELWIPDEAFRPTYETPTQDSGLDDYKIVFESDRLLLVNKRQGLAVHSGKGTVGPTLIDIIRKDFRNPAIDLCHRIDMNTGGLVMLAKGKENLEHSIRLFHEDLITKRYRCLVKGVPDMGTPCICSDEVLMKEISAFLEKPGHGNVFIHDIEGPEDLPIRTRYRVLSVIPGVGPDGDDVSELEVELVTGRTHQIRAQFAHLGHPILGDGNYGRNVYNHHFTAPGGGKIRYQQLFATTLLFAKIPRDNLHYGLSGRKFSIIPMFDVNLPHTPGRAN